ncbi:MAG: 4-(cytidine 5'-diphospho)-2-C-methyl-D-erythritol kinase [Ignavibacteriae bacterium]|nr:4-(cytidine 5'-diphospho)-2-C-methyl-D-erythritol kinase [Ignavibacteriota bacterium]
MITLKAYAKINLGLRLLRKREDGYHDIETIFHRINLFDEIALEPSSTISLTCTDLTLPTDERNLCIRAAQLLQQHCNSRQGVHISLKKNIPVSAGLGGGSSDGAATLRGLIELWNVNVPDKELCSIALQLGSDVAYFLRRGTAYTTGRGEVLEYFDLDLPYWIVVVFPSLHISTAQAYQNVQLKSQKKKGGNQTSLKELLLESINDPRMLMNFLHNDFESLILRSYRDVAQVKKALYDAGAVFAQLSGSGSAVYGLFSNEQYANDAGKELCKNYQVFTTQPHFKPD